MSELEQLKKENERLVKELNAYKMDAKYRGLFALNRMLNMQVDRLSSFDINKEIGLDPKEDKVYDRTMAIYKDMPKMIKEVKELQDAMGVKPEDTEEERLLPISPESIADDV